MSYPQTFEAEEPGLTSQAQSLGEEFQNLNDTEETITIKLEDLLEESGTPCRIGTASSYMMNDTIHSDTGKNDDLIPGALV